MNRESEVLGKRGIPWGVGMQMETHTTSISIMETRVLYRSLRQSVSRARDDVMTGRCREVNELRRRGRGLRGFPFGFLTLWITKWKEAKISIASLVEIVQPLEVLMSGAGTILRASS